MITALDGVITGMLSVIQTVTGDVSGTGTVSGAITVGGATDYPKYDGSYEITPKVAAQTFDTAYKVMTDDLTVLEIPYHETTNPSGGYTVIIG